MTFLWIKQCNRHNGFTLQPKTSFGPLHRAETMDDCQQCRVRRPLAAKHGLMICVTCANPNLRFYRHLALQRERALGRPSKMSAGLASPNLRMDPSRGLSSSSGAAKRRASKLMYRYLGLPVPQNVRTRRGARHPSKKTNTKKHCPHQ